MAALGCVRFWGGATAGPRPLGTAGAAGMTSFGTVMPAGGLADGARTELPGRGGNAEPEDLMVAGAAAGAGAAETAGEAVCTALTGTGAWGDRSLEGTPAYGSACMATDEGTAAGATDATAATGTGTATGAATTGAGAGAGATDGAGSTDGAGATTAAAVPLGGVPLRTGAAAATGAATGAATTGTTTGAALGAATGATDGAGATEGPEPEATGGTEAPLR